MIFSYKKNCPVELYQANSEKVTISKGHELVTKTV
jgi:hypothetical protein